MTFTTDVQNVHHLQWHKLQERVYREKIRTVEELQQCITEEWERLDQHVIDNAVKQWRKRLNACVAATADIFDICCECHTTFAYNADFYCSLFFLFFFLGRLLVLYFSLVAPAICYLLFLHVVWYVLLANKWWWWW